MSIRTVLEAALHVPVKRPDYKGDAPQYVTYHMSGQVGTIYAEGVEAETGTSFVVDIWSKPDYTELLAEVKAALQDARYHPVVLVEYFDNGSGYYHVVVEASCIGANYG